MNPFNKQNIATFQNAAVTPTPLGKSDSKEGKSIFCLTTYIRVTHSMNFDDI